MMDTDSISVSQSTDVANSFVTQRQLHANFFMKEIRNAVVWGNIDGIRQHFERWVETSPNHHAWVNYIRFELRCFEWERARSIFERYVQRHPTVNAWIRYAKFEQKNLEISKARKCFERAVDRLHEDDLTTPFYIAFGEFEAKVGELERALMIYKYALEHSPGTKAVDLLQRIQKLEEALERSKFDKPLARHKFNKLC